MVSMVSKHGAFVSASFPASKALVRAGVHLCSTDSSDLHVRCWMIPMIEFKFGMYSRLKFSKPRKARSPVMSFGGAISSNLVTSLESGLRLYSDMM